MNRDLQITFMDSDAAELEFHVRSLGELMLQSYADGDIKAAKQWLKLQEEAIAGRTPGAIARMEADYFGERGAADRKALEALAATRDFK